MNKGFFSVAIIVFIFIISTFFFTLNSQKEIYFSDSYRQMIFDSEQAYAMIHKNIIESRCITGEVPSDTKYGFCNSIIAYNGDLISVTLNCETKEKEYSKTFNFEYSPSELCPPEYSS